MKTSFIELVGVALVMMGGAGVMAADAAPTTKQRSGWVKMDVTLEQLEKAITEADAKPGEVPSDDRMAIDKLIRAAPDAILPQVAELSLKLKNESLWKPVVRQAFAEWSDKDGSAAAQRIEKIEDAARKQIAWGVVVQIWRQRNAEACWAYLLAQPDKVTRDEDMRNFLASYSHVNPRRTLEMASMVKNPQIRERALEEVAWNWAEKEPQAALAWVNSLPDAKDHSRLVRSVVLGLTSVDKKAGAALALSLPDETMRKEMVRDVHQVWSNHDLNAALTAYLKLAPEYQDKRVAQTFGFNSYKMDVNEILRLAEQLAPMKDARDAFLASAADRKSGQGRMEDAVRLVQPIVAPLARRQAVRQLAAEWGHRSPSDAGAWVNSLPPGEEREKAIEGMTWGLLQDKPEESLIWPPKMVNKEAAQALRKNLYANWWKNNKDAAQKWLDSNKDLTAEERQECVQQATMMDQLNFSS